ncbi:hypothetical protein pdam_00008698 [Pocillopora damicornis]|uniref:Rab-GAP TBC domain-containing protein n=1 Tax=Pocillopora damicornis TaxID=46731 RepID=A0A3M6TFX9_POCDA|nr:hypothetical protein pdam_00008698 [Pocillopora damicornis]
MDAELTGKKESRDADQDRFRRRSKTTPPASNQFAMSNSLDSRVGSFEEADSGDKSCTPTTDELQQSGNRQQYDVPASFRFVYLGSSVLDKRYTQHMLPWVIAEIRRKNERNQIDLNVKEMTVEAVDCSAASTLFQHKVQTITRCARSVDKKCFAYLTKIPDDVSSCHCYVFEAVEISSITGFFHSIRDAARQVAEQPESNVTTDKENSSNEPANPNSNGSPTNSTENTEAQAVIFPLWYVGRVMVSHRQAPPNLVDDLVDRFDKTKGMTELEKQLSVQKSEEREGFSNTVSVNASVENHSKEHPALSKAKSLDQERILGGKSSCEDKAPEGSKHPPLIKMNSLNGRPRSASDGDKTKNSYPTRSQDSPQNQHHAKTHSRKTSFSGVGENRNILFKISIHSIACLSAASRVLLMERRLREVSFCQQGTKSPEHFGFICHELKTGQYYCYVFKGRSEQLVDEVMQSLRQAFNSAWQAAGPTSVCDMCPLHQLHQLCVQLEGRGPRNQYDILQKHRINLSDDEMSQFTEQFKAESPSTMNEEIEVIMAIFRAMYEKRQLQHTHIGQVTEKQKTADENSQENVNQNVIEANMLKLSYNEVPPCSDAAAATWNKILENGDETVDLKTLTEAVKAAKRGEIWVFLAKQHDLHSPPEKEQQWMEKTYHDIKEGSTCHQHSIFIDLGRTFPNHPYFAPPLGHGQLCLFNILKAYSILDEEVGYCQGLSFVAGILLMHMKEEDAYDILRFMMYTLGVRKQYKPDMQDLQTQFYMLSRLLHDYYKPVYEFLLELEITPTLYAAPWFLTLFASHFPVGFVARVLDMMFLQGMEVVFKVILLLLGSCQVELLESDGLEGAVEVMKTSLAPFAEQNVEWLVSQVLSFDISKDLESYEVEYCVLKEEDLSVASFEDIESERVESLEAELTIKTKQIQILSEQLTCARNTVHSLESTINTMQINQGELKGIIRSLRAENESLTRNFEKLKAQVLSNGDLAPGVETADPAEDQALTIAGDSSEGSTIKPTNSTETNASSNEENTDSFEHIGSGNDLTDDEADSDEFMEGKRGCGNGSPPLSDKCEDLVVSR